MLRDALACQLALSHHAIERNTEGIGHGDSLLRVGEGANCMNWVLGHILAARRIMLRHCDAAQPLTEEGAQPYLRGSAPIGPGSEVVRFEELRRMIDETQRALESRLAEADDAFFEREVPDLFDPQKTQRVGEQLAALLFHEAYHGGQLGVIRHALGREPALA